MMHHLLPWLHCCENTNITKFQMLFCSVKIQTKASPKDLMAQCCVTVLVIKQKLFQHLVID